MDSACWTAACLAGVGVVVGRVDAAITAAAARLGLPIPPTAEITAETAGEAVALVLGGKRRRTDDCGGQPIVRVYFCARKTRLRWGRFADDSLMVVVVRVCPLNSWSARRPFCENP